MHMQLLFEPQVHMYMCIIYIYIYEARSRDVDMYIYIYIYMKAEVGMHIYIYIYISSLIPPAQWALHGLKSMGPMGPNDVKINRSDE